MTKLVCPDGCCDKDGVPRKFMNIQTLKMHLLHRGGVEGHPERTQSTIDRLVLNPKILPANNDDTSGAAPKKTIKVKKRGGY